MKVIVIGDGKVGRTIVEQVCEEGHEVVVIDTKSESIEQAIDKYGDKDNIRSDYNMAPLWIKQRLALWIIGPNLQ